MYLKYYGLSILFCLYCYFELYHCEKSNLITLQRPTVTYINKKYIKSIRFTSRRYRRQDPKYYLSFNIETLFSTDNRVQVDMYVYELIGHRYQSTNFELHIKFCSLLEAPYFGASLKKALNYQKCPFEPGNYSVENFTISELPYPLPFKQGRVYINSTRLTDGGQITELSVYLDLEVKRLKMST